MKHSINFLLILIYFFNFNILYANDYNQNQKADITDALIALQITAGIQREFSIAQGINWLEVWLDNFSYKPYDAVQYEGSSYICIKEHKSNRDITPENKEYWNILALKSDECELSDVIKSINDQSGDSNGNIQIKGGRNTSISSEDNIITIDTISPNFSVNAGAGLEGGDISNNNMTISVANNGIKNSMLADNSIDSSKIKDKTISLKDLDFSPGDIAGIDVSNGLSGGGSSGNISLGIANAGITRSMLAENSIDSSKIRDRSISIKDLDFTPGDITGVDVSNGLSGGGSSGNISIGIANSGIVSSMLSNNSIDSSKIIDGSITLSDLNFTPIMNNGTESITIKGDSRDILVKLGHLNDYPDNGLIRIGQKGKNKIFLYVDEKNTGRLSLLNSDASGYVVILGSDTNNPDNGLLWIGQNNNNKILLYADDDNTGHLTLRGESGDRIVTLGNVDNYPNNGGLWIKQKGENKIYLLVDDNNYGKLYLSGESGKNIALLGASGDSPNNGGLWISQNGKVRIYLYVDNRDNSGRLILSDSSGNGTIWLQAGDGSISSSGHKSFVVDHPDKTRKDKKIVYSCIEGPEVAAYIRGTAKLVNGQAWIEFPDHFSVIINAETLTVQATPQSASSKGLAVVKKNTNGVLVKELFSGNGNYKIDYYIQAVRKGYENFRVIRDASEYQRQNNGQEKLK